MTHPDSIEAHLHYEEAAERRREAIERHARQLDDEFLSWSCPNCGSTTGTPKDFDFGVDPECGYADSGTACSECL
jgi:hypothetical protein